MPSGRQSARRRGVAEDSDTEPEDGYTTELSEAQKLETLTAIAMADLSSEVRDHVTSVDFKGPRLNRRLIMNDRDCNKEGTEASERVERNRPATNKWNNFGSTDDAKKDFIEQLEDICGGQAHRQNTKAKILAEAATHGREPTLEDTYDQRRRRAGGPPSRCSRGGSHAAANDRGNFSGSRGGGNVGRGPGRAAPPASSSGYRPLDPAVDPNSDYGYKDKARSRGQKRSTTTMVNNTVRVTSSLRAPPTHPRALKQGPPLGKAAPSGPKAMSNLASMSPKKQTVSPATRTQPPRSQLPNTTLADSNSFMAAARGLFALGKTQLTQPSASASTLAGLAASNKGLLASRFAPSIPTPAAKESVAPIRRAREEFRDPDMSPAELTDALPSTGQLSVTSPSMESDTVINESQGGVGLGISLAGSGDSSATQPDTSSKSPLQNSPDLMDIEIPEVQKEVLVPSPPAEASAEEMVAISKAELEKWNTIKALMQSGDTVALMKQLSMQGSLKPTEVPVPTQPTLASVQAQPIKVSFPSRPTGTSVSTMPTEPQLPTQPIIPLAPTPSSDKVEVANGYAVNLSAIIGDKNNFPKGVATQTTPSLAASRWAFGPKYAVPMPQQPTGPARPSMPGPTDGTRPTSPITLSSTSSSSYHSSVEHIMTRPVMQNTKTSNCAAIVARQKLECVDFGLPSEPFVTITLTPISGSPMPRPSGHASASIAPATARAKTAVNPFEPRDSGTIEDDVVLDYGPPAKFKPFSIGTASNKPKPSPTTSASRPAADDLHHQRERMMAGIKDQLGLSASLEMIPKSAHAEKDANRSALTQKQKTSRSPAVEASTLSTTGSRPILTPNAPSSAAALRSASVRAGLTGSKWATTQPAPSDKAAPTTSSFGTAQTTPAFEAAVTTPQALAAKQSPTIKSALTTSKWASPPVTSSVKPIPTSGNEFTARPTRPAKSALTTSKWATAQSTSPAKSGSTLRERSPNKSSRVERDPEVYTNGARPKGPPTKPDSAIFGDAKLVSKLPYTASSSSSTADPVPMPPKKYTGVKYTAPGAGYDLLVREMEAMKVRSASTSTVPKSAEANSALASAKSIAQQFGVDEGDSDESEL